MDIQYLTDDKGERISVLVPFQEWNKLNQEREELRRRLGWPSVTEMPWTMPSSSKRVNWRHILSKTCWMSF